jgi:serine/threonine protein kinase
MESNPWFFVHLMTSQLLPNVDVERFPVLAQRFRNGSVVENESFQLPVDPKWELDARSNLRLDKLLGIGPVGKMMMAEVTNESSDVKIVAVKLLKQDAKPAELKSLICELEIMKRLDHHENIINLIGCCTSNCAPMLVMEFAELGSLQAFLKKETNKSELTYAQQVSFALQIAKGMQFLAENKVKCVNYRSLDSQRSVLTVST